MSCCLGHLSLSHLRMTRFFENKIFCSVSINCALFERLYHLWFISFVDDEHKKNCSAHPRRDLLQQMEILCVRHRGPSAATVKW